MLGRERPRTDTSDCHEQHPGGVRIREYRAATAAFSKGRVCGGVRRKNGLQDRSSGVGRNPLRGTANRQPLPEESCRTVPPPRTCARTRGMTPGVWGWRVSQGHHLKRGQGPPGRGYVLFLPEQPQQDVFLILGPAVDVSVLKPGGHVLLWEREAEQWRPLERNLDSRPQAQFPNLRGRALLKSPGSCAVWLLEGVSMRIAPGFGVSCRSHYGNHMCAAFSVSLPGYLPFAFQRAFHHPHIKGVGRRSRRVM